MMTVAPPPPAQMMTVAPPAQTQTQTQAAMRTSALDPAALSTPRRRRIVGKGRLAKTMGTPSNPCELRQTGGAWRKCNRPWRRTSPTMLGGARFLLRCGCVCVRACACVRARACVCVCPYLLQVLGASHCLAWMVRDLTCPDVPLYSQCSDRSYCFFWAGPGASKLPPAIVQSQAGSISTSVTLCVF
eukprot:1158106-Pelagomonas_calceolata.AAC.17